MKNTINISNNANLILNTYRCLFFKLLLRVFSVVQQLRSEHGNGKVLESALQHSKFFNQKGAKMVGSCGSSLVSLEVFPQHNSC